MVGSRHYLGDGAITPGGHHQLEVVTGEGGADGLDI
jgi:hypothetical protein